MLHHDIQAVSQSDPVIIADTPGRADATVHGPQ